MAIRMLGLFMILPVFVVFAEQYDYANKFLIGLAIGIYGLTQGILQIPFGYLSDKFGRKTLIIIGLIIFIIGSLIAALSNNIYYVILGRFIAGAGAVASVIMAYVADVITPNNRAKANAGIGAGVGFSFMLALVIGPIIASYFNLSGIFYFTAILGIFAIIVVFSLPNLPKKQKYNFSLANLKSVLDIKLNSFYISIFILHFILTSIFLIVPKFLTSNISLSYLIVLITSFILIIPLLIITERKKLHKNIIIFSLLLIMLSQLFLILQNGYLALILLLIIFFMGFNLIEAITPSIISKITDNNYKNKKGLVMGCYTTFQFLGVFSGGIISGYINQNFSQNYIFIINIILIIFWLHIISRRKIWRE